MSQFLRMVRHRHTASCTLEAQSDPLFSNDSMTSPLGMPMSLSSGLTSTGLTASYIESSVSVPVPASLEELKSFCKGYLRGLRSVPNGHRLARDWCFPMGDVAKGKLDGAELPELTSWVFECVGLTVKYGTQMPPVARTTTERNRARRERQGR